MTEPSGNPGRTAGRRIVLLIQAQGFPAAELSHNPSNQIVLESGSVDHLNEEAVGNGVERILDVHRYGDCSARGLLLVKARDYPSRNG